MSDETKPPATTDAPTRAEPLYETPVKLFAPNGAPLHMKRFMDGRLTPQELHQKLGFGKPCIVCGGPPAIRIRVFMPLEEAMKVAPELCAGIMASNPDGPYVPTVKMKNTSGSEFQAMKASDCCFCANCKVGAEREAAKGPSWAIIEIDRGPDATNKVAVAVG